MRKKIVELGNPSRRGRGIGDATKIAAEVIGNFMRHAGIVELPPALEDQMIRLAEEDKIDRVELLDPAGAFKEIVTGLRRGHKRLPLPNGKAPRCTRKHPR